MGVLLGGLGSLTRGVVGILLGGLWEKKNAFCTSSTKCALEAQF